MKKSIKITTLIIIFPLITLLLYGALSHLFFFYTKNSDAQKELQRYSNMVLTNQKKSLVEKVENLTQYIRYYNYKSSDKVKKDVKNYVYLVSNLIHNVYNTNIKYLPKGKLKNMILNSLQKMVIKNKNRYFFLLDTKGNLLVHPNNKLRGKNVTNLRDISGKYFVKEFLGVIEDSHEGFVDYYWYKPDGNSKKMFYKISFVKSLDIFNWYIGSGEYLKDMIKNIKSEMLSYIKHNAYFENGYFFISNSKNEIIFHPKANKNHDIEELRLEGIYEDNQKIAYTSYVAEYDWYITAVKSMEPIRKEIKRQTLINEVKVSKETKTNLYIMLTTWLISLILSLYLSLLVNKKLKDYEEKLEESNQKLIFQSRQALIGELFSMIAHQWRQPINKIASIIAPLRFNIATEKPNYGELDKDFQKIEDSVEFMSNTIEDFRTFYKPKNVQEIVNLKELIEKSIDFLSGSIHKKDIKIVKNIEDISTKTHGNEFLQVMINIIKNAIDAVGQRGVIRVSLYSKDAMAIACIEDNGSGINDDLIDKIFDPYFSTKDDSMGLGLYMCRLIIQKHLKGDIKVTQLEKGTLFTIELPITT